ncbi:DUF6216 family protein [Dyella kyungheensis]|uniref:DUF6216 family protein n=1 Tax=Dyella kyungheensis TaxID=1242174 RepID=UPI003CEEA1B3
MIEVLHSHLTWLVSGILFAIALLWAAASTQSLFEVRYRLWRLVRSGHEISDETVRAAVQERADFMAFRALLAWADTPGEMKRISDFAKQHELEPGMLGDCGPYFHRRDLTIKENVPSLEKAKAIHFVLRLIFLAVAVFGAIWLLQSRVLVSFKDDGTKAWLGTNDAKLLGADRPFLISEECPKTNTGAAGFNVVHTKALCEAFGSKAMEMKVSDGLMQQRVLGALLLVLSAACYMVRRRRLQQVRAANAVRSWLAFRQKPNDQGEVAPSPSSPPASVSES